MHRIARKPHWVVCALLSGSAALHFAQSCGLFEPVTLTVRNKGTTVQGTLPDGGKALISRLDTLAQQFPDVAEIAWLQDEIADMTKVESAFATVLGAMLEEASRRTEIGDVQSFLDGAKAFVIVWKLDTEGDHETVGDLATQITDMRSSPLDVSRYVGELAPIYASLPTANAQVAGNLRSILATTAEINSPEVAQQALAAANSLEGRTQLAEIADFLQVVHRMDEAEGLVFTRALNRVLALPGLVVDVTKVARVLVQEEASVRDDLLDDG